jgi:hypothetical protein
VKLFAVLIAAVAVTAGCGVSTYSNPSLSACQKGAAAYAAKYQLSPDDPNIAVWQEEHHCPIQ